MTNQAELTNEEGVVTVATNHVMMLDGQSVPDREVVGGKAWSIARMRSLGLRVPPAFVLPLEECRRYHANDQQLDDAVWAAVLDGIAALEEATGRHLGDPEAPLLVSVRSGSVVSMPGMMDTVLNLGITDAVEAALAEQTGDAAYACDSHARFCHQFGEIVLKADLDPLKSGADAASVRSEVQADNGQMIPTDPHDQLRAAICAVFDSWTSARARSYRRHWGIAEEGGTAVTVQAMVFGNLGEQSGTGVLFSRNPLSGAPQAYGEWLPGGQGDDVVGGTHAVLDLRVLAERMPEAHTELLTWAKTLEAENRDVQDIEFTIERGTLYLLQTRTAKRSPEAAVQVAVDLVAEGLISIEEALSRVTPEQVAAVLMPSLDPEVAAGATVLARGEPACPGVAVGVGVLDPDEAERRARAGEDIVLARPTTSPNDVHGMIAAVAVVTDLGGVTSHAAVVTRALGRPSVVGVGEGRAKALAGETVTVDGGAGVVYAGELTLRRTTIQDEPSLVQLDLWASERCPVVVLEVAPDGVAVIDIDALVAAGGGAVVPDELVVAMTPAGAVSGAVLVTVEGARAVLASGVPCVVASPALPVRLQLLNLRTG